MNNQELGNLRMPHFTSLLLATIVVAAILGPIGIMAAKMTGL